MIDRKPTRVLNRRAIQPIAPLRSRRWLALALLAMVAAEAGCVTRRFTVNSNPPGARVIVDDKYDVGVTPASFEYTYYGTRKITLIKDGYETLTVMESIPPPVYDIFPVEFFTENFIPYEFRDERSVNFDLKPQRIVPREELLRSAEQLRQAYGTRPPAPAPAAPLTPTPQNVFQPWGVERLPDLKPAPP